MSYSSILKLPVYGMNCAACASRLQAALNKINGISAEVNFALESAQISFTDNIDHANTLTTILAVLDKNDYQTDRETLLISVSGWNCASCANKTTKVLNAHPFILAANSNLATDTVQIQTIQGALKKTDIDHFSTQLPYQLSIKSKHNFKQQNQQKVALQQKQNNKARLNILAATLLSIPFLISMVHMFIYQDQPLLTPWLEFLLATPVQFIIGSRFYKGAWLSIKNFTTNMDVLIILGTSAAYFYSLAIILSGSDSPLYFESSTLVISLVTLGKYLEHRAKQSTSSAINALMALRPDTARVKKGKKFIDVNIDEVQIGDQVQVAIGEKVAVDGLVIEGQSYLDESLLTGESKAILKVANSQVIAGSLNGDGVLLVKTEAVGESTSLSKIIALVENAQMSKAPIMQLVDKISAIFVPIVLLIATLTFMTWYFISGDFQHALISAVAVLVIACPCALGLATPTAMVVGTGVAAQHGILIKDIKTLQLAYKLQTIIFDKTGTLTQGNGKIDTIVSIDNDKVSLLSKINALQVGSKHPIAHAVKSYCLDAKIEAVTAKEVQAISGEGIYGKLEGKLLIAGNLAMMQRFQINVPTQYTDDTMTAAGSLIYAACDGVFLGYITIVDQLRPESLEAIQALHKRNIETVILSGDKRSVVEQISAQLKISKSFAELKPEQKLAHLLTLQKHKPVAMVGDGVNDAPALAQADVSIAMGTGSDVAKESASITLMRNDPRLVVQAIDISKATWVKIQQNLFWAFIFNTVAIPAAAMGYLSPAIAGGAMALSSITVLTNSLLLKRFKLTKSD
ncbi:heavy metal translocating P-type ATPase [Psychromonas antarctica]|uniref:heavy metal translocating P-type ATPase n=1 Tax=Psychromonas antarctica TaxID=67573 RepID=UPI001EE9A81E|nr:heavy metal translocating P-type ATPase [Psychromonas antarctica]MCG6202580.1 heavy metal translocating P-type ATPase [Psychromonas antarctica]